MNFLKKWFEAFLLWLISWYSKHVKPYGTGRFGFMIGPSGDRYAVSPWGSWYRVTPRQRAGKKTKRIPVMSRQGNRPW